MTDLIASAIRPLSAAITTAVTESRNAPDIRGNAANFADMLSGMARDSVNALHAAEQASVNGLAGKLGVQDVVASVMAAERALQTAIAIRDKTIGAIQEISRMQI
jgi:flagellar hook-basal body complex protein FliE